MHEGVHFLQDGKIVGVDGMLFDRRADLVPRHLLITGLGRSGTTACASIADRFGMKTASATVYLENRGLRQFIRDRNPDGAIAEIATWPAAGPRLFWKDPKIWSPVFDPFLDKLPPSIGLLYVFRDPLNIASRNALVSGGDLIKLLARTARAAQSLAKRVGRVRHRNVALISYEKLLLNPDNVVNALARFLQISDTQAIQAAIEVIEPTPDSYESHFRPVPRRATSSS